ncbi:dynein axonemal intermediate chain 4 isoform X2 [Oenanthe melanoleuca]|uniref:dynein axonemal intermediate chain 4 isoform X2 n=1 Tax=Oenanthe melanoleuca TaxID=2939378 RepID=UPI0024C113E9|nr:dynein axonemal intermediate chain 4 isoform X2 [Oenanthe melanoleuca]
MPGPRPPPAAAGGAGATKAPNSRRTSTASQGKGSRSRALLGRQGAGQVFDEEGKNVTPHPLFQPDPNAAVTRTHRSSRSTSKPGLDETEPHQDPTLSLSAEQQEGEAALTEAELEQRVDVFLSETDTLWMLDLPTALVCREAEEAGRVLERNKIYTEICNAKIGSEYFEEKIVQTISGAAKTKEVQCETVTTAEKGMMVTFWDLDNSLEASEAEAAQTEEARAPAGKSSKPPSAEEHSQAVAAPSARESAGPARSQEEKECSSEEILASANLQQDLVVMERILMENIFQPKLALYRQIPVLIEPVVVSETEEEAEEDEDEKEEEKQEETPLPDPKQSSAEGAGPTGPSLEQLWSYRCDLTSGHSVSSMAWNKVNPDLIAVGYREFVSQDQKKGLACCWSLKNPMWPERVFRCEHGVTAVDFSLGSPSLLAVGMSSGCVAIYDVRSRRDAALLDSSASLNKHKGPVWQLRWVEQDRGDKTERLMCISGDGRMTQWFIQQRLDCFDVMKIKRTESGKKKFPGERERKSEGPISQEAAGMCFDFHPENTDIFLAGTEEGHIHCCSCSGKERILGTYRGHKGPVYKVAWNPSSTDMFLSCSADWSILLWHRDSHTPLLTFTSVTAFVHDIKWAPQSAFIFVAVNERRVEIWDLSVSIFQPVLSCAASPEGNLSSLLFARNAECLLLGDSCGQVGVWQLHNLAVPSTQQVGSLWDIVAPAGAPV